jgi:hypothetical protein
MAIRIKAIALAEIVVPRLLTPAARSILPSPTQGTAFK